MNGDQGSLCLNSFSWPPLQGSPGGLGKDRTSCQQGPHLCRAQRFSDVSQGLTQKQSFRNVFQAVTGSRVYPSSQPPSILLQRSEWSRMEKKGRGHLAVVLVFIDCFFKLKVQKSNREFFWLPFDVF